MIINVPRYIHRQRELGGAEVPSPHIFRLMVLASKISFNYAIVASNINQQPLTTVLSFIEKSIHDCMCKHGYFDFVYARCNGDLGLPLPR